MQPKNAFGTITFDNKQMAGFPCLFEIVRRTTAGSSTRCKMPLNSADAAFSQCLPLSTTNRDAREGGRFRGWLLSRAVRIVLSKTLDPRN